MSDYYIFDFDGTIADSYSLACHILINHAVYLGCKQLTPEELLLLKNFHAREVLKTLNVPFWRIASFVKKLKVIMNDYVHELTIFPEWPSLLKALHGANHLGIISSNSYHTVEFILKKFHLMELFDFISCDNSLFGKKWHLRKIVRKKNLTLLNTYYIGDEVRDIEAAQAAKIQSIAVTWGFNSAIRLKQANPDIMVDNREQLAQIFLRNSSGRN